MKLAFESPLRPVDRQALEQARTLAEASPRHRGLVRFHDHEERIQRMINVLRPESYVRPHRHAEPAKTEIFVILAGRAHVLRLDDSGNPVEKVTLVAGQDCWGVEIAPGTWHSVVPGPEGAALYEIIEGPFDPRTHKEFMAGTPDEGSDAGRQTLETWRQWCEGTVDATRL